MTYGQTLEYLYTQLPMYQRVGKQAYKKDLTNTIRLMEYLDNPHRKFKSVHIAGTNGKGTSAHGIAAALQVAGFKVGLYTSPHLKNFTERIRINGKEVSEAFVVDFVDRIKPAIEEIHPSFFEITVAMAFDYFVHEQVDIAVVETGLGGRLDSTNVITPVLSLITNIGYDHMDMLGDTLEKIAAEKAGIIKEGVPVVIGEVLPETQSVFEQKAHEANTTITYAKPIDWDFDELVPTYLKMNIPGIVSACEVLSTGGFHISDQHIKQGVNEMNRLTGLKGRFQVLCEEPLTIADVSHNMDGLRILLKQAKEICQGCIHLIFGTVKDKALNPIFSLFPKECKKYWTQSSVPRALSVEELAIQGVMNELEGECFKNVNEAIHAAKEKAQPNDLILITGSTFVVAEIEDL
ncbi:bifunctional folylpolyglutamate synthase/dihydrofolate synthase [Ekhidna sp.]|uniref:bifunctional folylpolyglutamate synthase/dihydrofolate synthase n=1 Tax=Ekhidna sp. TaxID=2608089 RepID=UPI003B5A13C4